MSTCVARSEEREPATVAAEEERVTPLELFFDLVFVLAITQCTALMSHHPTWSGLIQGLLVLGMLWWAWTGYAWLTSVVDPEDDAVRIAIFAAMAALLIVSLTVREAFGDLALTFGWSLEWGGRDAFVDEIYVEPAHRQQSLARAALRGLMEEARAAGVRALHLEAEAGNAAGQALYRAEGFSGSERRLLSRRLA